MSKWTQEQVDMLNQQQQRWDRQCENQRELIATQDGWVCKCGKYTQDWSHETKNYDFIERLRDFQSAKTGGSKIAGEAADHIEILQKYRNLVMFIANDYHELSHDKIKNQRNEWKKLCQKLIDELES